jgi:hypothetical protein
MFNGFSLLSSCFNSFRLPSSCGPEDRREEGGLTAAVAAVDAVDRLGRRHVGGHAVLSTSDVFPATTFGYIPIHMPERVTLGSIPIVVII